MSLKFSPETGPLPKSEEDRVSLELLLNHQAPAMSGGFDQYGVFTLRYLKEGGRVIVNTIAPGLTNRRGLEVHVALWSPKLAEMDDPTKYTLELDPNLQSLWLIRSRRAEGQRLDYEDIREIAHGGVTSGFRTVSQAGYLLRNEPGSERFKRLDEALSRSARGEDPGVYDSSQFVRLLDGGWERKRVLYLEMQEQPISFSREIERDCVVLAADPKVVIPRAYETPLAFDRLAGGYRAQPGL